MAMLGACLTTTVYSRSSEPQRRLETRLVVPGGSLAGGHTFDASTPGESSDMRIAFHVALPPAHRR